MYVEINQALTQELLNISKIWLFHTKELIKSCQNHFSFFFFIRYKIDFLLKFCDLHLTFRANRAGASEVWQIYRWFWYTPTQNDVLNTIKPNKIRIATIVWPQWIYKLYCWYCNPISRSGVHLKKNTHQVCGKIAM